MLLMKYKFLKLFLLVILSCNGQVPSGIDYRGLRERMVKEHLESRGIYDKKVLEAMRKVERHLFVPEEAALSAYGDFPLPIGYGQTISQPYVVAFMTQALSPGPGDKVLEVGTGSGYQAAILGEICDSVFTIEIVPQLGDRAKALLKKLDYKNIFVRTGDGYKGWPEHAPFDAIIVTAAPSQVPAPLTEQLKEGGKMVIPVGDRGIQQLFLLEKRNGKLIQKAILDVIFVPLVDENKKTY
jgi:protein-L-isoaspartate(D-aspartate) O-methyltransferase